MLHDLNCVLCPTQVLPPTQLLTLCCLPLPQVVEHALYELQEPQDAGAERNMNSSQLAVLSEDTGLFVSYRATSY